jgi:hypothetical protein
MAKHPLVGQGFLIIEVSRSHSDTPHSDTHTTLTHTTLDRTSLENDQRRSMFKNPAAGKKNPCLLRHSEQPANDVVSLSQINPLTILTLRFSQTRLVMMSFLSEASHMVSFPQTI